MHQACLLSSSSSLVSRQSSDGSGSLTEHHPDPGPSSLSLSLPDSLLALAYPCSSPPPRTEPPVRHLLSPISPLLQTQTVCPIRLDHRPDRLDSTTTLFHQPPHTLSHSFELQFVSPEHHHCVYSGLFWLGTARKGRPEVIVYAASTEVVKKRKDQQASADTEERVDVVIDGNRRPARPKDVGGYRGEGPRQHHSTLAAKQWSVRHN